MLGKASNWDASKVHSSRKSHEPIARLFRNLASIFRVGFRLYAVSPTHLGWLRLGDLTEAQGKKWIHEGLERVMELALSERRTLGL